jgi:Dockerin type I domain
MTHGTDPTPRDITLPLAGTPGIECRSSTSLGAGNYTMVFTFPNNLVSVTGATVTSHNPSTGTGTVSGNPIVGPNASSGLAANQCQVNLTSVSTAQYITVTLNNVLDAAGNSGNVTSPKMGVLVGDVNATGHVDAGDIGAIQQVNSQSANSTNFRADVNVSGHIDAGDIGVTQSHNSTSLPSTP